MKKTISVKLWILTVLSGILLSIPYTLSGCGWVAFIALIPLLTAEYIALQNGKKHFWINYYTCFFIWNLITTYWIWYATQWGAVAALLLNSLQMALIFRIFRWFRRRWSGILPYIGFAALWLCWEHFYFTWQVSWPWLTLGNAFATNVKLVQWYSVTGTLGGSLWILVLNILIFRTFLSISERKKTKFSLIAIGIVLILPIVFSSLIYGKNRKLQEQLPKKEVVILQPNIDPYNEKFVYSQQEQDELLLSLANEAVTTNTFLVVAPETFFNPSKSAGFLNEDAPHSNLTVQKIDEFAQSHKLNFLYGASSQLTTVSEKQPNVYARKIGFNYWLNTYNSAVFNNSNGNVRFYHKSKLVIMAESVPMINKKPVLESFGVNLGGVTGNFTPQEFRTVFKTLDEVLVGSAICYESVFGEFYREYIQNGATLMTIITNDGWWKNTFGHIQHFNYARLRAIETRRYIARSANTGISAIIDINGDVVERTPWWKKCYIRGEVAVNKDITPFVKYGDVIGMLAAWSALALFVLAMLSYLFKRK